MATIIPIYNSDQQASYNYSYPPHYTSMAINGFDKPPSYEQTIQGMSENNNNLVEGSPATTTAPSPEDATRNQF